MYVSSSQMPAHSRVWIYQSNREFSTEEISTISENAKQFLEGWTAHDKMLTASFEIRYNRFLILLIDEKAAGASGCSIDKSVHFIRSVEKDYRVSMMDRMLFAVKNGNSIEAITKNDFEKQLAAGAINEDTIVFNNLVQTKGELENKWEIPLKESWHKSIAG